MKKAVIFDIYGTLAQKSELRTYTEYSALIPLHTKNLTTNKMTSL